MFYLREHAEICSDHQFAKPPCQFAKPPCQFVK